MAQDASGTWREAMRAIWVLSMCVRNENACDDAQLVTTWWLWRVEGTTLYWALHMFVHKQMMPGKWSS